MKVVLLQDVPNLGKMDEIKEVSDGYARNYLFTRNLAVPASTKIVNETRKKKQKEKKNEEIELKQQQKTASELDGYELEVKEKASENGKLYASVSKTEIASELKKRGYKVKPNQLEMKPIKETGEYEAVIKFGHGLESKIHVIVSAK